MKGKIKEHYQIKNCYVLFDGELLNGIENRVGKEYYEEILIFEGQYINNKRNGYGKEYNCKGELIFGGEYLNDERWNGKGIEQICVNDYYE